MVILFQLDCCGWNGRIDFKDNNDPIDESCYQTDYRQTNSGILGGNAQVWSLSNFKVSRQLLVNGLNLVSSVSLLKTASTALANEGLFKLTQHPSLTQAVLLSFFETIEVSSCKENMNQVSLVSLHMTSSTALANEGLFELTRRPS